ncbi:MAG TPA: ribosome recycling factor [Chloroflexota bacterium]|jgi:ribosome recycling factor|nr:ribosome recycling factor [Chloroflexota bacterium]
MVPEVMREAETKMSKSVEHLKGDLMTLRTGRANPGLVERLPVEYYGTPTPLIQLASIHAPEARLIVIQPYDKSAFQAIEKAILKSDLHLTPANDGRVIRLPIPPLTEERRRDMVKLARKRVEEGRIAIRNIRRDAHKDLEELESEKMISADELARGNDQLQRLTDRFMLDVDKLGQAKEAEILEV